MLGKIEGLHPEKTLMRGKTEGKKEDGVAEDERGLDSIIDSMDLNLSKLQEICCSPGGRKESK